MTSVSPAQSAGLSETKQLPLCSPNSNQSPTGKKERSFRACVLSLDLVLRFLFLFCHTVYLWVKCGIFILAESLKAGKAHERTVVLAPTCLFFTCARPSVSLRFQRRHLLLPSRPHAANTDTHAHVCGTSACLCPVLLC